MLRESQSRWIRKLDFINGVVQAFIVENRTLMETDQSLFDGRATRSPGAEQVNDEDQSFTGQRMPGPGRPVGKLRRNHQLTPPPDLHTRDAVLPPSDESIKRKLQGFPPVPGTVKLGAAVVINPEVVHIDHRARRCRGPVSDDDVLDDQVGGRRSGRHGDLRFTGLGHDGYRPPIAA